MRGANVERGSLAGGGVITVESGADATGGEVINWG
jgi:hypothetical protein